MLENLSVNNLGIALGRNRDELAANIMQHGLDAHARDLVGKSPDFAPTRRASGFSGGLRRCKNQARRPALPWILRLASHPENPLARPQIIYGQVLSQRLTPGIAFRSPKRRQWFRCPPLRRSRPMTGSEAISSSTGRHGLPKSPVTGRHGRCRT